MSDNHTLNLGEIDPPIWRLLSGKVAYGPYTLGQLKRLIEDKQLTQTSKLAKGDNQPFLAAREHPAIQRLLTETKPTTERQSDQTETGGRFVLVFYGDNESRDALFECLNDLGEFAELIYGSFVLKCALPITEIQRALSAICSSDECFVLTEADTGRLAWHGVTDEVSEHVRSLWKA